MPVYPWEKHSHTMSDNDQRSTQNEPMTIVIRWAAKAEEYGKQKEWSGTAEEEKWQLKLSMAWWYSGAAQTHHIWNENHDFQGYTQGLEDKMVGLSQYIKLNCLKT